MNKHTIKGNIVDALSEKIFAGELVIDDAKIISIRMDGEAPDPSLPFIIPGLIDSHVHIESSMLVPSEFARLAVIHGTVATVSDPHEIANVCGIRGVEFMIDNGKTVNFKFHFGAPSCVPATVFETAGDTIGVEEINVLLDRGDISYLSEMMNFPGVINGEKEVVEKMAAAIHRSKPIDGHAPGLRGEALAKYIAAGISTDHECFTKEEALEKLSLGMKILIREGSAAKNFDALIDLLEDYPDEIMFCTDDKHPDSLVNDHINRLCARAVQKGISPFKAIKAACINPVLHYRLPVGLLREGDPADFVIVKDLQHFEVLGTFINGGKVAEKGRSFIRTQRVAAVNRFHAPAVREEQLKAPAGKHLVERKLPVIEALDGQLITHRVLVDPKIADGAVVSDPDGDVLKLVVVNRYQPAAPAVAFIRNFGFKSGAIASSVAHDSHNIIAVGVNDDDLAGAINLIVQHQGGISFRHGDHEKILPLPVAGLMSDRDGFETARDYTELDGLAKSLGCRLSAPYVRLSFMALLVIPSLKLSDKGLFDGDSFRFIYQQ